MKANEYRCECCGGVFEATLTDEQVRNEAVANFGPEVMLPGEGVLVCDDCYKKMDPQNFPDILHHSNEQRRINRSN